MNCLAAAPTGIAAANIEIDGTDICAATLHSVFDLDGKYESKLDFTKPGLDKVAAIMKMKAATLVRVESRQIMCRCCSVSNAPVVWYSVALFARKQNRCFSWTRCRCPSTPPHTHVHLISDVFDS